MTLDDIAAGSTILVDANLAIYARRGMSAQCRRLLARCATREVIGVVTTIAVAEFCHRRMMQEAQSLGLAGSNPAKALGGNPALIGQLSQYALDVEDLLAGDLVVVTIEKSDLLAALTLQHQHGLLTNDSLHLAASLRTGVKMVATNDAQFDTIPGITIFKPSDVA